MIEKFENWKKSASKINEDNSKDVVFDTTLADNTSHKTLDKAEKIRNYFDTKIKNLKNAESKIKEFMKKFDGYDMVIGNMSSPSFTSDIYKNDKNDRQMIAHCSFKLKKESNDNKLLAQKMKEAWDAIVDKNEISALFQEYDINGVHVEFQIWVK